MSTRITIALNLHNLTFMGNGYIVKTSAYFTELFTVQRVLGLDFKAKLLQQNKKHCGLLNEICQCAFDYFGANQMCYAHINYDGMALLLNTHQALWKYYLDNECYKQDPLFRHPSSIRPGVAIWSSYRNGEYISKALQVFSGKFNVDQGISIVKKDQSGVSIFAFGGKGDSYDMMNKMMADELLLNEFFVYFVDKAENILDEMKPYRISVDELKNDTCEDDKILESILHMQERITLLRKMSAFDDEDLELVRFAMSEREAMFSQLQLFGCTITDISKIFSMNENTVNTILRRLKKNLGVNNRRDFMKILRKLERLNYFNNPVLFKQTKKLKSKEATSVNTARGMLLNSQRQIA